MFIRTEGFKGFLHFYPIVSAIIILQVSVWLFTTFVPEWGQWLYYLGVGINLGIEQGEYWRLVTPIFLHGGFAHLAFNSFSLILFAPALEQMLGKFKFIVAYLITGIAANILTYIIEPNPLYAHVGASGAIFGLFGLYMFMIFFEKQLIDPQSARLIFLISIIGLVMTFLRPNINIAGHIFGFIAGFALGPIILKNVTAFVPRPIRRKAVPEGQVGFDPNRWNKKQYRFQPYLKKIIFGFFILLVVLGLLGSLL
ncbi:rhomboid family intramembrane serine protease [Gracilibacillus alcaliphilus]|uniref:rhomboid family intramembrane serine protease n=1 Tax=Gracilibacillus alcaliphilus TaxID=1401441 RepID=UPI00195B0771|nr:rhomboid family intramembrane serine protease [Gracilibacillus alcaliphilus]MBM7679281.1 membrane associated rhomboid family serine protease [Gracilibacillus alcaliphilus]